MNKEIADYCAILQKMYGKGTGVFGSVRKDDCVEIVITCVGIKIVLIMSKEDLHEALQKKKKKSKPHLS